MKIEHNHEHHEKATGNLLFVFILPLILSVISVFSVFSFVMLFHKIVFPRTLLNYRHCGHSEFCRAVRDKRFFFLSGNRFTA